VIAHRGAPLRFPEHTKEPYEAGARQGAGIVECDVTFTKDGELVCRHAECDLHTTTNIVATELNDKCSVPWTGPGSSPRCCTSDLTLNEFKSLKGKMDASNASATTAEGFLSGTPSFRTDLYNSRGTLLTLRESIALNRKLGVKHTPELKEGDAQRIMTAFGGQENYAQAMIDEFKKAGVNPKDVFAQSFNKNDILYWVRHEPQFDIITWSFERADLRKGAGPAGFYYLFDPDSRAVKKDSDMYKALDALAHQVRIRGIFSDWPATVTYYANCMGLE
jgi:glycerophosphoryl diester phosphodiesterase